jgi:hypothetical protein
MVDGSKETFVKDLEQSWIVYKFQAQIYIGIMDIILQHHPRRIWLYVKHLRLMCPEEYAMFAAKTKRHSSERSESIK